VFTDTTTTVGDAHFRTNASLVMLHALLPVNTNRSKDDRNKR
jgi:hypothetical protein